MKKSLLSILGLTLICVVAGALNIYLIAKDNRPPPYDYATYLSASVETYHAVINGSFHQFISVLANPYRPPLIPLSALPFYAIFGTSYQSAMLVNVLYLVILIICTYKLTKAVSNSTQAALVALGIICFVPGVMAYTRVFGLDFPTTALVSAGLYFTVAGKGFNSRNNCVALGVVLGLGMLSKWTYIIFVIPMIIMVLIQKKQKLNIKYLALVVLLAAIIALPWYINAIHQGLIQSLIHYGWGEGAKAYAPSNSLLDSTALLFYPKNILTHLVGRVFGVGLVLVLCLALPQVIKQWEAGRRNLAIPLCLSFLVPLAVFTLLDDKGARFMLPAVPCLLVILVWAGFQLHVRLVKAGAYLLTGLLIAGSILSLVGALQPALGGCLGIYEPVTISNTYFGYNDYSPPKSDDWKLESIIKTIANENKQASVGILANDWVFNQDTLHYYAVKMGYDSLSFRDFRNAQVVSPYDNLDIYNIVLLKTDKPGGNWDTVSLGKILDDLENPKNQFYVNHKLIQSYDLPDGNQIFVYIKI